MVLAVLFAGSAWAQGTIQTILGDSAYDGMGRAMSWVGDVNNDGRDDLLVGAPWDDNNGQESGVMRVYNVVSGAIIYTFDGDSSLDEFGFSVAGVGDVNGDGRNDFAGGAHLDDVGFADSGTVRVYSGATSLLIYQFTGDGATDAMGASLGYLGDVNGDGRPDILVGADEHVNGVNSGPGYARVYSGATGTALYTVISPSNKANDRFGYSASGGRDLNGDGVNDFVVGSYGDDTVALNSGGVFAFNGTNGALLWSAYGDGAQDHLGADCAVIGDVTGDGRADVIAGAPNDDNNGAESGAVRVYNGATGAVVTTINGVAVGDQFGWSVNDARDLNNDGREEFLVGASFADGTAGADIGKVYAYSGATLTVLQSVEGSVAGDRLGFSCAGLADTNGDGTFDYAGGASQYGGQGGNGTGYARVYDPTGTPPPPPPPWPTVPSSFVGVGAGYNEGFEGYGGTVPAHMAVNELNSFTRQYDPDAWCNIGQNGSSGFPARTGSYALEVGGNALGMTSSHDVSNGLVIGLNGAGAGPLMMDLWVYNHGEDPSADDGIWLSQNGTDWEMAYNTSAGNGTWSTLPAGVWTQLTNIDLNSTTVSTNGDFYLLIGETDNNVFATTDGMSVDDVVVRPLAPPGPTLAITPNPPTAGTTATVGVSNNNPGDVIRWGYSLAGGGPTQIGPYTVLLTPPFTELPTGAANAAGIYALTTTVPLALQNRSVWVHALNITQNKLTNGLTFTVQ